MSGRVVRQLMEHTRFVGHHLYTDNFYTKVPMLEELYEQKVYCCGTARADRSGFPCAIRVKSMRGRKRGDNMWRTKSPILAQVWIDSRVCIDLIKLIKSSIKSLIKSL